MNPLQRLAELPPGGLNSFRPSISPKPGEVMANSSKAQQVPIATSGKTQNETHFVPKWTPSSRTSHVRGANALLKSTRNTNSYMADMGRNGVLDGYDIPKRTLSKGSHGAVKVSVQLYEEEAKLLMEESQKTLKYDWSLNYIIGISLIMLMLPFLYLLVCHYAEIDDATGGFQDRYIKEWIWFGYKYMYITLRYSMNQVWKWFANEGYEHRLFGGWIDSESYTIRLFGGWMDMFIPRSINVWACEWLEYATDYYIPMTDLYFQHYKFCMIQEWFWFRGSRYIFLTYIIICTTIFLWAFVKKKLEWRCWDFVFVIDALAFDLMDKHPNLSKTQLTTDGVSSHPVTTTVINTITSKLEIKDHVKSVKYNSVIRFLIAMKCDNRLENLSESAGLTVEDMSEEDLQKCFTAVETNDLQDGEREVVGVRTNAAAHKRWRKSVTTNDRSADEIDETNERGIKLLKAHQDYEPDQVGGVQVGPRLSDVTESLDQNKANEMGAISRHLSKLISKVTGEEIPEPSPEAEARMDKAAEIIGDVMAESMDDYKADLMNYSFPLKWGILTIAAMFEFVAAITEYTMPRFSGFVKKMELALPLSKLPRMVVSQGVEATAAEAEFWCVVENLFKKCFPHLITKGKTEDEISQQIADMCRRSKTLCRLLASLDMSSMDASWTAKDRKRIYDLVKKVLEKAHALLQTELDNFDDPILFAMKKKAKIRITMHYIRVTVGTLDSILMSGERKTSTGNRLLMLMIFGAELLRVYGDKKDEKWWHAPSTVCNAVYLNTNAYDTDKDGEDLIKEMMYYPREHIKLYKDDKDPNRALEIDADFRFYTYDEGFMTAEVDGVKQLVPKEKRDVFTNPDQNCNSGDGDDDLVSMRRDMYKSEEEMMLAWEKYAKLVEVCSPWDEDGDAEVLSKFIITTGSGQKKRTWCIPKVQRNFGRLLLMKMNIPAGMFQSNGKHGYKLTQTDWIESATQLWNRSYALRHTLILRQLCGAMFWLCVDNIGDDWKTYESIYDDEGLRLGKENGDTTLSEMAEQVAMNVNCIDGSEESAAAYALLKAMRFKTIGSMQSSEINRMRTAIIEADTKWKELALTDAMCHNPVLFVDSFPIDPELAGDLGYTEDLIALQQNTYLVKGQSAPPEMSGPCATGTTKDSRCDGPKFAVFLMVGEEDSKSGNERKILVGEENETSARKDYVSLPGGKTESRDFEEGKTKRIPFWICTAIRELREETGYHVSACNLNLVTIYDLCGCVNFVLYTTRNHLKPAAFTSGEHVPLKKLGWRTASEILNEWHPRKTSENIWRVIHLTKEGKENKGHFRPYNELSKYVLKNCKLITFLHFDGTTCVDKHGYQVKGDSAFHIVQGINYQTGAAKRTGCELQNAGARSKSVFPRVGGGGTTSVTAHNVGVFPESSPQQQLLEQTNIAGHANHGQRTGGIGTPPGLCRGMVYGPGMQGMDAQKTSQSLGGSEVEGTHSTMMDPALERPMTQGLSGSVKSDPGLPVAGLSNTDTELDRPRPPATQAKPAEASNKHTRVLAYAKKGRVGVGNKPGPKNGTKPNPGSGLTPGASVQPVVSQGTTRKEGSHWRTKSSPTGD